MLPNHNRKTFLATALLLLAASLHATPSAAQDLQIVALGGDPAPGLEGGTNFTTNGFRSATINANGEVAFLGIVSGNLDVLYFGASGAIVPVAVENEVAPGAGGQVFCNLRLINPFTSPIPADDGTVAFVAQVKAPESGSCNGPRGLWTWDDGTLALTALEGGQAADQPADIVYDDLNHVFRHSDSGVLFESTLLNTDTQTSLGTGIWAGAPDDPRLLALEDTPAPDLGGPNFENFYEVLHANTGQSTLFATFNGAGSDQGIYLGDETSLDLVYRSGAPATEFGPDYEFTSNQLGTRPHGLSDSGDLCLPSAVVDTGDVVPPEQSLWRIRSGGRDVLAAESVSDPGLGGDFVFSALLDCFINQSGTVLFRGIAFSDKESDERRGIWLSGPTAGPAGLTHVTTEDDVLQNFNDDYGVTSFSPIEPHLNASGHVAFEVDVIDPDTLSEETSIWWSNGEDELLLAVTGQQVMVGEADLRTLTAIAFGASQDGSGNEDGKPSAFSDGDEVVFIGTLNGVLAVMVGSPIDDDLFADGFESL